MGIWKLTKQASKHYPVKKKTKHYMYQCGNMLKIHLGQLWDHRFWALDYSAGQCRAWTAFCFPTAWVRRSTYRSTHQPDHEWGQYPRKEGKLRGQAAPGRKIPTRPAVLAPRKAHCYCKLQKQCAVLLQRLLPHSRIELEKKIQCSIHHIWEGWIRSHCWKGLIV